MVNWILGDLFLKDFGHQGSIQKLWKERWQFPVSSLENPAFAMNANTKKQCKLGVYPYVSHSDG